MFSHRPVKQNSIVFLGDSLTEAFDLDQFFPDRDLVNRGVSGDTTLQVNFRIEEIVTNGPRAVFLMIGINDLFHGYLPDEVAGNITGIVAQLKQSSRVFLQSILPVNETFLISDSGLNTNIHITNNLLRKFCKENEVEFLDFHSEFLNNTGEMDSAYTYDGAHLTREGYRLWASLAKPFIDELENLEE